MRTQFMFVVACVLLFAASALAAALVVAMIEDAKPARMEIRWYQMCIAGQREGWSEFGQCPRKFLDAEAVEDKAAILRLV